MLRLENLGRVLHTHDERLERLAVLGLELREGVTLHLGNDGHLGRHNLLKRYTDITYLRSSRCTTDIEHITLLVDIVQIDLVVLRYAVGNHRLQRVGHGVSVIVRVSVIRGHRLPVDPQVHVTARLVQLCQHLLIQVQHHGFGARHRVVERFRQLVGTELHILCPLFALIDLCQHEVAALVGRVLELAAGHGCISPLHAVGIGRGGHLLAAKFVLALALCMLHPLEILHTAADTDGRLAEAELVVSQHILSSGQCRGAHQLAVHGRIKLVRVLHVNARRLCVIQHLVGLHRTSFIPPQQRRCQTEHHEPRADALERASHTCSITCCCCLCVSHNSFFFVVIMLGLCNSAAKIAKKITIFPVLQKKLSIISLSLL